MQRYPNTFSHHTANLGQFHTLIPLSHRQIAPGTTLKNLRVMARVSTSTIPRYVLSPSLMEITAFYIPNRLVMDDWPDFAGGDVASVPTTTAPWDILFNHSGEVSALARRAYKLVYNQFYGQEGFAWYDDITADGDTTTQFTRIWDQFNSKITNERPDVDVYTAPVTGTAPDQIASITLDEFARSMRDSRSKHRMQMTGNKYVDIMRAMGVDLDWRVQMAPEFLGKSHKVVAPIYTTSYEADSLEVRKSRYESKLSFELRGRKSFAEHGTLMTVLNVRPAMMLERENEAGAGMTRRDQFYWGDNATVWDEIDSGTGDYNRSRLLEYRAGRDCEGGTATAAELRPWFTNTLNPAGNLNQAVYPDPTQIQNEGEYNGAQLAVYSDIAYDELTPVPPARV